MAYQLGNVKPWVAAAANDLGPRFGITQIGGYRDGQFVYGREDHPGGLALDFMTRSGQALADYARVNAQPLGVNYVIWDRRIWSRAKSEQGWRPYSGSNPHIDHVHVSFVDTPPGRAGSPTLGGIVGGVGTALGGTDALASVAGSLRDIAAAAGENARVAATVGKLFLPNNLMRAGLLAAGGVFVVIGVVFLAREVKG